MGAEGEEVRGKEKVEPRKYYCTMEYPLYLEKHHWNTIWLGMAHILGIQGWLMLFTGRLPVSIMIPSFVLGYFAGCGITVGCHRYWAHRTFKAKLPLQIFLMIGQTMGAQYPIFKWCRDHRLHHKYTETDADPHDARRGFWFSHMGWLFEKEHPSVKEKEATIDLTDLDTDPVVKFQTKYYWGLLPLCNLVLPVFVLWLVSDYSSPGATLYQLICYNYAFYITELHVTWLVNSAAHMYGYRPYDTGIHASENVLVSMLAVGEGYHNYHHTFPWDYKAAELGAYGTNWSALFIDFFGWIGLAYDLKTVPYEVVKQRVKRTGDVEIHQESSHSHRHFHNLDTIFQNVRKVQDDAEPVKETLPPWGWGDESIDPSTIALMRLNYPRARAPKA